MTCPICNGARRVPWPEAGMMQDCECVRVARLGEAALRIVGIDTATVEADDPWALPEGLRWRQSVTVGWLIVDTTSWHEMWLFDRRDGSAAVGGETMMARPDAPALIDLLRRRNGEQTT